MTERKNPSAMTLGEIVGEMVELRVGYVGVEKFLNEKIEKREIESSSYFKKINAITEDYQKRFDGLKAELDKRETLYKIFGI